MLLILLAALTMLVEVHEWKMRRERSLLFHHNNARETSRALKEARDVLSDNVRRAEYDRIHQCGQRCHYEVLNVRHVATNEQIQQAYRKHAIGIHHALTVEQHAADRLRVMEEAHDVLIKNLNRARAMIIAAMALALLDFL